VNAFAPPPVVPLAADDTALGALLLMPDAGLPVMLPHADSANGAPISNIHKPAFFILASHCS